MGTLDVVIWRMFSISLCWMIEFISCISSSYFLVIAKKDYPLTNCNFCYKNIAIEKWTLKGIYERTPVPNFYEDLFGIIAENCKNKKNISDHKYVVYNNNIANRMMHM